jgi:soluble lytic murein transglycosylase-like protein
MIISGLIENAIVLKLFRLWAAAFFLSFSGVAIAQDEWGLQSQANDPQQPNDCVTQGAVFHGVNPWVVRAIIKVESNFNAKAVNKNKNGTSDIGLAQINSMHMKTPTAKPEL